MSNALIIIDMQLGSFSPRTLRYNSEAVVARINALAAKCRAENGRVIFVQHDGPEGDPHHPDESGWHLLPELDAREGDLTVRKTSCDSFLSTDLDKVLRADRIGRLVICGCATEFCVDTTVRTALGRGYHTTVAADAHTTAERPHLSAKDIIAHHNATWADFISPAGPAQICDSADVEFI
ncbi:cysteine hydrolase family protein [Denitrobaculum tricleocarpae]|uniref:Cysteine hydrolase n=1 Tax=Denitrobaculum tricleocarpae TaxID=2591009 RepID=A0A545TQ46_9PROT|nr:cysteine hydrolase family protein [Denitrobaculum tricleocarpae]TQV79344.1 cysteine hydrolase [Denitrobaculum tricleocarpae]